MAYAIRAVYDAADINLGLGLAVPSVVMVTGDCVPVWVTYGTGAPISGTVSDGTNTYTRYAAADISDSTNGQSAACFVAFNVTGGTYTVTYTPGVAENYRGAVVVVASGLATSGTPDIAAVVNVAPGTGTDAVSSGNINPSGQPAMLLAFCLDDSGNGTTLAAGSGFTSVSVMPNIANTFGVVGRVEHLRLTSTASVAGTFTASIGSGYFFTTALVIQEPGAVGGSSFPPVPGPGYFQPLLSLIAHP